MLQFPQPAGDAALGLARALRVTRTAGAVLVARGLVDADESQRFLDPRLAHLTVPDAMKDRAEAVARIARAVRAKERVCVFGDYDADGVTAAALLTDVLRPLGAEVIPLLADRFNGGYGLSALALARVLATGATLLITCDCGSSDHERLEGVRRAGVDAVVIDHHRVPDEPLPAVAFLNPHRPECGFAYKGLASVGLALSVGAGVRAELGVALDMRRWLDLVAIGTIGDVAPLDGDTRATARGPSPRSRGALRGRRPAKTCRSGSRRASTRRVASTSPTSRSRSYSPPTRSTRAAWPPKSKTSAPVAKKWSAGPPPRRSRCSKTPSSRRCRPSCSAVRAGTRAAWAWTQAAWRHASESRPSFPPSTVRVAAVRCAVRRASRSTTPWLAFATSWSRSVGTTPR